MCFALIELMQLGSFSELLGNALTEPAQSMRRTKRGSRDSTSRRYLANAAACGRGARMMRSLLRPYLAAALHHLGTRLLGQKGSTLELAKTNSIIDKVNALLQVWGRWAQVFPANWTFGLESAFFERRERSTASAADEEIDEEALRRDARIAGLYDGAAPSELKASLARLRYYIRHRTIGLPPSEAYREAAREHDARVASMAVPAPVPPESDDEDVDGEACDDVDDLLADVAEAPAFAPFPVVAPPVAPLPVAAPAFAPFPVVAPPVAPKVPPAPPPPRSRRPPRAPPPLHARAPPRSAAGRPQAAAVGLGLVGPAGGRGGAGARLPLLRGRGPAAGGIIGGGGDLSNLYSV